MNDEDLYLEYSYLFGESFKKGNKKTKLIRTIFDFGAPLKVDGKLYKNRYDHVQEQEDYFLEFS